MQTTSTKNKLLKISFFSSFFPQNKLWPGSLAEMVEQNSDALTVTAEVPVWTQQLWKSKEKLCIFPKAQMEFDGLPCCIQDSLTLVYEECYQ